MHHLRLLDARFFIGQIGKRDRAHDQKEPKPFEFPSNPKPLAELSKAAGQWVGHWEGPVEYAAMPVYAFPLVMLTLTLFRTVLEPVQNAVSRRFERQCDRYALERTGLPEAYLSAFRKLARQNKDDPDPPRLEVLLFHSHPPIAERLAMVNDRST